MAAKSTKWLVHNLCPRADAGALKPALAKMLRHSDDASAALSREPN
jgi:hypothetical protein